MEFEFEGISELVQELELMGKSVEQGKDEALVAGAEVLQKAAKERVPVRTGNLMRHVNISEIDDGEIEVYVDQQGKAYYGYFLEVGTSKMRAQPFMGPAFNASKLKIERTMAEKLRLRIGLL